MTKMTAAQLLALHASNAKAFRSLARKHNMSVKTLKVEEIANLLADPNHIAAAQTDELVATLTAGIETAGRPSDMTEFGYQIVKLLQDVLEVHRDEKFSDWTAEDLGKKLDKKTLSVKGALIRLQTLGYVEGWDGETGFDLFWMLTEKGWNVK